MSDLRDRLLEDFQDPEYRHAYVESFLNSSIAAQIRVIRKARRFTQKALAKRVGSKQSGISRLEDASYDGWSIATLHRLARAFDVSLVVRFESFGNVLADIATFGAEALAKPEFKNDPVFQVGPLGKGDLRGAATVASGKVLAFEYRSGDISSESAETAYSHTSQIGGDLIQVGHV